MGPACDEFTFDSPRCNVEPLAAVAAIHFLSLRLSAGPFFQISAFGFPA